MDQQKFFQIKGTLQHIFLSSSHHMYFLDTLLHIVQFSCQQINLSYTSIGISELYCFQNISEALQNNSLHNIWWLDRRSYLINKKIHIFVLSFHRKYSSYKDTLAHKDLIDHLHNT